MRKICVVTGTRAEYGLLHPILKLIKSDPELLLQLIVTGMHLSSEFGLTYREIEGEFQISKKIEILLSSDSSVGVSKAMGLAQISFSEAYEDLKPDLVLLLGDRFEIFSAASAALIGRIPIAHVHGGESTEGAIDEAIRHSITKMSHIHFVATEEYKNRIIQLGENPRFVFNFGAPGIDNIKSLSLLEREELEKELSTNLFDKNIVVTYHPETLQVDTSRQQFGEILDALCRTEKNTKIIFTKSNADMGGRLINEMIDEFVIENRDRAIAFKSLGQLKYLSLLKNADLVLGNSSSGLLEAPSLKIGTLNIGSRQDGRIKAKSVVDCNANSVALLAIIQKMLSNDFKSTIENIENPYGNGGASLKIVECIKNVPLENILKKKFYNIENHYEGL